MRGKKDKRRGSQRRRQDLGRQEDRGETEAAYVLDSEAG